MTVRSENAIIVHRMESQVSTALRVKWYKIYLDAEGNDTTTPTAQPAKQRLEAKDLIRTNVIVSRDGVLGQEVSRALDQNKWTFDSSVQLEQPCGMAAVCFCDAPPIEDGPSRGTFLTEIGIGPPTG